MSGLVLDGFVRRSVCLVSEVSDFFFIYNLLLFYRSFTAKFGRLQEGRGKRFVLSGERKLNYRGTRENFHATNNGKLPGISCKFVVFHGWLM